MTDESRLSAIGRAAIEGAGKPKEDTPSASFHKGHPDIIAALGEAAPASADRLNLGLATTRELLDEIRARIECHFPGGLDYRTVDPR